MKDTPPMASIGRMSKAKTVPEVPVSLAATCDQLPGALPKSASTVPGLIILSFSLISKSLYAARAR